MSTLFASILKFVRNVRQIFAADDFSRCHFSDAFFLGALRVNLSDKHESVAPPLSCSIRHLKRENQIDMEGAQTVIQIRLDITCELSVRRFTCKIKHYLHEKGRKV